jgi:cytosine/adenosine deaminase-related metal-dependent hydrolase
MKFGIKNLRIDDGLTTITVEGNRIVGLQPLLKTQTADYFDGKAYWLLPGLINAHDHLGLDLLPPLGTPPYPNSEEWGKHIYHPESSPLKEIWQLSTSERLLWGAYRNLLSGVTTVQHHDRGHWRLSRLPIRVPAYRWLHRPGSALKGQWGWNAKNAPLFIHCGEGTDLSSYQEVTQLQAEGLLTNQTVLIHAIALKSADIALVQKAQSGVILCPHSNQFLYGQLPPIETLRKADILMALGTDSTASGSVDLMAELRGLRGLLSDGALLAMVTRNAAQLLGVPSLGVLKANHPADFVLLDRPEATSQAEALLTAQPADIRLVVLAGRPVLTRPPFIAHFAQKLQRVLVNDQPTWLAGSISSLLKRTEKYLGKRLYFAQEIST